MYPTTYVYVWFMMDIKQKYNKNRLCIKYYLDFVCTIRKLFLANNHEIVITFKINTCYRLKSYVRKTNYIISV